MQEGKPRGTTRDLLLPDSESRLRRPLPSSNLQSLHCREFGSYPVLMCWVRIPPQGLCLEGLSVNYNAVGKTVMPLGKL